MVEIVFYILLQFKKLVKTFKKNDGPDRYVSNNQLSSVTLNMKARESILLSHVSTRQSIQRLI